ncbi:hypothetical protein TYRP_013416 [Tyrophagus putrescentiae]|nr:hypothetical protein TYRP_013416 [Tyrophagus putrescentiae]
MRVGGLGRGVCRKIRLPLLVRHNVISDVPVLTSLSARFYCARQYRSNLCRSLADKGGCAAAWLLLPQSILQETQTEPIEGVIIYFKNELYFCLQIAYSAKNYLHIFISKRAANSASNKNTQITLERASPSRSPACKNIKH